MKNLYSFKKIDNLILSMLLVMVVVAFPEYAESQTLKSFTQRTSIYSPTTQIYKIKGDFTMVGNTNMTLVNYGDETNNSNLMRYVDVDGVAETLNSSSSSLTFSTENGANPNCSNIIYAGLYWTGRADDGGESPLTVSIPGGTSDYQSGNLIKGYTLTITQTGNNNDLTALYTFTPVAGGDPVVFTFYSTDNGGWSGTLTVKVGAAAAVPVPFTFTTGTLGDNWALATLTTPYTIGTGSTAFQVNTLRKARENNTIDETFYSNITTTGSTLNKLQVKLRHGSDTYQTVTANVNDIFYPSNASGNMYSAYAEVTDYVQEKGLGVYTVADIALREGDGGGTGFFGGWGMIVVYENPLMKDRDVTIFDGHAYVYDELGSDAMTYYTLPISGFNTAREGHITMKYGLIAGEGDRELGGSNIDRFSVRNHSDDDWVDLSHPNNSTDNFFYSSIYTGGNSRTPEILNNTGMDLVMDTVTNLNNAVITTNQTSTTFRYGTNQDTYIIFCIAMSVNAYRPEVEGLNSAVALNSVPVVPPGTTLLPGDVVTYEVQVRNKGNEAIENGRMVIPVPFTAVEGLVVNYVDYHLVGAQTPYFDENEGANGSIIWEMGTLPVIPPPDDDLLGVLDFSFTVTTDCATLALVVNEDCTLAVDVDGTISGVGAISGNELAGASFITGYDTGECEDLPIYEPVSLEIDALEYVENNCGETNLFKDFLFCNYEEVTIPITEFTGEFPAGSRFYDEYPVVATSTTEYTISNPFPATLGTNTYYALFPGTTTCYYQFTISVVDVTEPPVPQNAEYCVGETAGALTATTTDPSYSLFFYNSPGGTATSSITPSTATAGTFTYWVAQGVTGCVGPTATITVTVNPLPELTCPQDISVNNDPGECEAEVEFSATVGLGATLTYTVDGSPITSPYAFPVGVTTVTATAENDCGQVTCTFTVTVTDNEKPVITTTAVSGSHLGCNPVVTPPVFTGSDNCGGVFSPLVNTDGDKPYDGHCDRYQTWTATYTDNAGNVATEVSVTYIWTEDGIPPVIETTAVSGDLGCNPEGITTPTFTLTVDPSNCIVGAEIDVQTTGPVADAEGCGWSQSWTANITDQCGNVATPVTITYTWTVDTEIPVISTTAVSGDLECNSTVVAPVFTGLDNCAGVFTPSVTTAGPSNQGCAYTQTWAANYTDACGNAATEVTITYTWTIDTEKPVISTTAVSGDLECNPTVVAPEFTGLDNCAGVFTPSVTTAGPSNQGCAYTQTWAANYTDACGNVATPVTITYTWTIDTEKPVISTLATSGDLECNPTVVAPVFTGLDNCAGVFTPSVTTAGPSNQGCAYTQTWAANYTDACGNAATEVTITYTWTIDTEKPVISTTAVSGDLECNPTVVAPVFTGLDNCAGVFTPSVTTAGPSNQGCAYTQTWAANYTDACGNVATPVTITYTWTIDTEKPVISTTAVSGDLECNPTVVAPVFTGLDNCAGVFTPSVTTAGPSNQGCAYTQTWAANYTDACGNVATPVTITYTWTIDTELPVITLNGDALVTLCVGDEYTDLGATATDNCSGALTPTLAGTVDTAVAGTYTLTFSVTDNCDNAALQVTRTVIVSAYPELNITGFTANEEAMEGDLETGYLLDLDCSDTEEDFLIQFAAGTTSSEALAAGYFGLFLTGSTVSATDLATYYTNRGVPEPYLSYLIAAANGTKPFAYINGSTVLLVDGAKHEFNPSTDVAMTIPGDFPFGTYTVSGTIVDESGCETPVTFILKVQGDRTPPELNITGFTANEEAMEGDLETGYLLDLDCSDTEEDFLIQFAAGTTSSEALAAGYFGLFLTGSTVSATDLATYYTNRGVPEPYLSYLIAAANGTKPFAYINGSTVLLVDGAKHEFNPSTDVAMTIPGDFPFGTYTVSGTIVDESGCETLVTFILKVQGDRTPPELNITGFTANEEAMEGDLETGYLLDLDCSDTEEDFLIQFAAGTTSSEALAAGYFGLFLTGSTVSATDLATYYTNRGVPEPYLSYLIAAANGTKPFAYINGSTVLLVDGAKHEFNPSTDVAMTIPGDFPFGTYTVSGTIVDESGCETPVTFILKVQGDRTPPEVSILGPDPVCPASKNVYTATEGMETYLWSVTGATISGTNTAENVTIVSGTTCSSTFELTLSVTAPNGCSGTATKTVTVNVAEDFLMPANTMTTVACIDDIVVPEPPEISDACGALLIPVALPEPEAGLCGDEMVYAWTYEDCAGHLHTWTHTIMLEDDEFPEITCPVDISVTVADGVTSATVTIIPATATDNCSVNVEGERSDALALDLPYPLGVTTITWTATDWCGNAVTCTSTVTVNDRPHISGTVYHDKDRLDDGMVDGTGTDGEGLLYVNLVDADELVVASVKVDSDGTYGFSNVDAGTYTLQLTVNQGNAGAAMPATALPVNWINTGENLGAGAGSDGTPDGTMTITVDLVENAEDANFGIVKEQDVTVSLTATPNVMAGTTNFFLYIKITELNGVNTQDTITVQISRDERWNINGSFNTSLTMLGSTLVNNGVWTLSLTDDYYIFKTTEIIQAGQFNTFGFQATFSPGNTRGISTITAQIKSGSGGENKVNNNADSEKIDYFVK